MNTTPGFYALAAPLVAAFVALTLLPGAAGADLTLSGANPHASQAQALFAALPGVARRAAANVRELTDPECKAAGWDENVIGMAWKDAPGTIQIRQSYWAPHVFAHEVGHQVWWQVLSPGNRSGWAAFWKGHLTDMGRWYAKTSSCEGYAESFALTYVPDGLPGDFNIGHTTPEVKGEIRALTEGDQYDAGTDEPGEDLIECPRTPRF